MKFPIKLLTLAFALALALAAPITHAQRFTPIPNRNDVAPDFYTYTSTEFRPIPNVDVAALELESARFVAQPAITHSLYAGNIADTAVGVSSSETAQTTDTYTVPQAYNCGRASQLYCYGIPLQLAGASAPSLSIWIDEYIHAYPAAYGFMDFPVEPPVYYTATTSNFAYTTGTVTDAGGSGQTLPGALASVSYNFAGMDVNGKPYSGTALLTFGDYYYSRGGGGRGGGGAGWRFSCTGGIVTITHQ